MTTTEFNKMWGHKYLWTGLFEAIYIALYITTIGFISIGIVYLIPCPAAITPDEWYYFSILISVLIGISIFLIVRLRFLDIVFGLADSTFFMFKSKNWKHNWNLLNHR